MTSENPGSHSAAKRIHRILPGLFCSGQDLSGGVEAGQIIAGQRNRKEDIQFGHPIPEMPRW